MVADCFFFPDLPHTKFVPLCKGKLSQILDIVLPQAHFACSGTEDYFINVP